MSITHHHICAVLNTELDRCPASSPVRVLDMGCGNGHLIAFLHGQLGLLRPDLDVEIYGFDVADSNVQTTGDYFANTINYLNERCPGVAWQDRLRQVVSRDPWPYQDDEFDFVVSNQVMEHVRDHDHAFGQIRRVLKTGGRSVHLFPVKNILFENHLKMPFAHWISNDDLLVSHIRWWTRLGVGRYHEHAAGSAEKIPLEDWVRRHADYMIFETNYLTMRQLYRLAKRHRLRCSFRYTGEYFRNKFRSLQRRPIRYRYALSRRAWLERATLFFYSFLSSVTLFLENENRYPPDRPHD